MKSVLGLELIKKLKDFLNQTKNDKERKAIKDAINKIEGIKATDFLTFFSEFQSNQLPQTLMSFMEQKKSKISLSFFEIIYFCIVNNLFNISDVLFLINCLTNIEWELNTKLKALQMFFYFMKMNLTDEACFAIFDLIVNSFVKVDPDLDSITRPIICQIIEIILSRKTNSQAVKDLDTLEDNNVKNVIYIDNNIEKEKYMDNNVKNEKSMDNIIEKDTSEDNNIENEISVDNNIEKSEDDNNIEKSEDDNKIKNDISIDIPSDVNQSNETQNNQQDLIKKSLFFKDNLITKPNTEIIKFYDSIYKRLLKFINDCILKLKRYFISYALYEVICNKHISDSEEFGAFVKNEFPILCLEILKNGKNEERKFIYNSILKIREIHGDECIDQVYIELYKLSNNLLLDIQFLRFISEMIKNNKKLKIRDEIKNMLIINFEKSDWVNNEKAILIFQSIIQSTVQIHEIDGIIHLAILKITDIPLGSINPLLNSIFIDCLEHCILFDNRKTFEFGLQMGYKVNLSQNAIFKVYKYMKTSWHIYFKNTKNHFLSFLSDCELSTLTDFIYALPKETSLSSEIFLNSKETSLSSKIFLNSKETSLPSQIFLNSKINFKIGNKKDSKERLELFEKILFLSNDFTLLMDLILQFYSLNADIPAVQSPLKILIKKLSDKFNKSNDSTYLSIADLSTEEGMQLDTNAFDNTNEIDNTENEIDNNIKNEIDSNINEIDNNNTFNNTNNEINSNINEINFSISEDTTKELFFFINEILRTVSLSNCWLEVISLIRAGYDCKGKKSELLLQISQDFIQELTVEHLKLFFIALKEVFQCISNEQSLLNAVFIYGEFLDFTVRNSQNIHLWRPCLSFGTELINSTKFYIETDEIKDAITKADEIKDAITKTIEIRDAITKHVFRVYRTAYLKLNTFESDCFEKAMLNITEFLINHSEINFKTILKILKEWRSIVISIEINENILHFISLISLLILKENEEISLTCYEILKIVFERLKDENEESKMKIKDCCPFINEVGHKPEKFKSEKNSIETDKMTVDIYKDCEIITTMNKDCEMTADINKDCEMTTNISEDCDKMVKSLNKDCEIITTMNEDCEMVKSLNQKVIKNTFDNSDENYKVISKSIFNEKLKKEFKEILLKSHLLKYSIALKLFDFIPYFPYDILEIEEMSEILKIFVAMDEPYRNKAIDCFIKTCSNSGHFTFCLKILSSWLSKDKIEISLSLISKISENLNGNSDVFEKNIKLMGLSNFLDYSIQFSANDTFLEPVLSLICKSECNINITMLNKIMIFSKTFLIKQLLIRYSQVKEEIILNYLCFLTDLISSMAVKPSEDYSNLSIEHFKDILIEILKMKTYYLTVKLESYKIMFKFYKFYVSSLEKIIRKLIKEYIHVYLRSGVGLSSFFTAEVVFVLKQMKESMNMELIKSCRFELTDLILIDDFEIVNSVRLIFISLFESESELVHNDRLLD